MQTPPPQPAPGAELQGLDPRAAGPFRVRLPPLREGEPPFEGPLDLLLQLVQEHAVDLFQIPIAQVTEGYLATLRAMQELDIDVAGEFLHMAAQLLLMKSKLLLPRTEVGEDAGAEEPEGDPRAELVRRLLEYQKYRAAAEELGRHEILGRDLFVRRARPERPPQPEGPDGLAEVTAFQLVAALDRALRNLPPALEVEGEGDRLSITDAIGLVAERLRLRSRATLAELLAAAGAGPHGRVQVIATFLALLELARLKLIRIHQEGGGEGSGELWVEARETLGDGAPRLEEAYR